MRVVCVHPAKDPVACGNGPVRIGSAPDDDIVSIGAGVDPHHVTLAADARGVVLNVGSGCRRVYVNARVVREKALLRYGDTLMLGTNKFLLMADAEPGQADATSNAGVQDGRVLLRIVSGHASGQALAVAPELHLGAGSRHFGELPYTCSVVQDAAGLAFDSGSDASRVNGWICKCARLKSGDQIVLGEHRLVVEAPGLQYAAHMSSLPPRAVVETDPEPVASPHTEIWWLIAAAVVLAVVIALSLYFRW